MAGLLDWAQSPAGLGLLGAVAGGFAGARRGTPFNNVGRGLAAGLTSYQAANDQVRAAQNDELNRRYHEMKMREIEQQAAKAREEKAWREGLPAMMDRAKTKAAQFEPDDPFNEGAAAFDTAYGGDNHGQPVGGLMATVTQQGDPAALEQYMLQPGSPYADEMVKRQLFPEPSKPQLVTVYENGQPVQKWLTPGKSEGVVVGQGKPDNQSDLARLMTEMNALPAGDPRRTIYKSAIDKATTHQPGVNVSYGAPVAGVDAKGNPVFFQPNKTGGAPVIIPGVRPNDQQGQTFESAGKIAMAQQAIEDIKAAEALLFGQNGRLMNSTVWAMNVPGTAGLPGNTDARNAYSAIHNAVAAKLRLETGAAANQGEIVNIARRFMPTPADTAESARNKLNRLRTLFDSSLSQTKGVRRPASGRDLHGMSDRDLLRELGE